MATKRDDHYYRQKAKRLRAISEAEGAACHLCGGEILYSAHYNDPLAFSADHLKAVASEGGSINVGRLLPAHRRPRQMQLGPR